MLTAEWFSGDADLTAIHDIRREVFIKEQGVSEADEMDGTDISAIHLLVRDDGIPVATGRMLIEDETFMLWRIAVLKNHRGKKYGDFVVRLLIRKSFEMGGVEQHLHSQVHAKGFYEKLGFKTVTDEYTEAGIPHVGMVRVGDIGPECANACN